MDREALEGIPGPERKRQEVSLGRLVQGFILTWRKTIFELINTESTYVRDLQLIVEVRCTGLTF